MPTDMFKICSELLKVASMVSALYSAYEIYLWSNFVHFITLAHRFTLVVFHCNFSDLHFRRFYIGHL